MNMNTTDILKKTEKLVSGDRGEKHGDKVATHENIARLWSSYLQNKFKQSNYIFGKHSILHVVFFRLSVRLFVERERTLLLFLINLQNIL